MHLKSFLFESLSVPTLLFFSAPLNIFQSDVNFLKWYAKMWHSSSQAFLCEQMIIYRLRSGSRMRRGFLQRLWVLYGIEIGLTQHSGVREGLRCLPRRIDSYFSWFCCSVHLAVLGGVTDGGGSHLNRSLVCVSRENQGFSMSQTGLMHPSTLKMS